MTEKGVETKSDPKPKTSLKWTSYQKYIIFILLLVHTFNLMDRQLINVLSPAIKQEFVLSDSQIGILTGLSFALLYAIFGFPIARLADKKNRVNIIAICLALWSAMTALCGVANNYLQLLLARMGVGVGEAGCNPPAHSLISDYFPREQRATALGIYSIGLTAGALFGIWIGGYLASKVGWRWAFIVLGLPGVLLALILKFTIKEPIRGATESAAVREALQKSENSGPSVMKTLRILAGIKSYVILVISAGLTAFSGYALSLWIFHFIERSHGLGIGEVAGPLGFAIGVGGGIGIYLGGIATDYLAKKDLSSYFLIPSIVHLVSVPIFLAAMWVSSPTLCFFLFFFVFALHASVAGPYYGVVQNLAPVNLRAFAIALFAFFTVVLGLGLGPFLTGILSDILAKTLGEANGLRWSLTALAPIWVIAAIMTLLGRKALVEDLRRAADSNIVTL